MASLHANVYDDGLNELTNAVTPVLYLCKPEPTTYTEAATTYKLGTKTSPTVGAPESNGSGGRKVEVATFTDGTVDASDDGTGTHYWALVDANDSRLLAVDAAGSTQPLTEGNDLKMTSAFIIDFSAAS
jgi:hypothetical protein